MRKPREELVKRGVLLEDPEQGEFQHQHMLSAHVLSRWLSGLTCPLLYPHWVMVEEHFKNASLFLPKCLALLLSRSRRIGEGSWEQTSVSLSSSGASHL